MQVHVQRLSDYMEVELAGPVDLQLLLDLIARLGTITRDNHDARLLFDTLNLEGEVHMPGQMKVGEAVANSLAHLAGIASVVPEDKITRTSEQIARGKGLRFKVFASKDEAIAWLRSHEDAPAEPRPQDKGPVPLDPARAAIWTAMRHLFPAHAQAIQLPTGALAISWAIANQPDAVFEMATPITIRMEPELVESLRLATADQRKRIAAQQESFIRAGMVGYDPFTSVPKARVIVLG